MQEQTHPPSSSEYIQQIEKGKTFPFFSLESDPSSLVEARQIISSQQRRIDQLEDQLKEVLAMNEELSQSLQKREKEVLLAKNTKIQLETKILQLQTQLEAMQIQREKELSLRQTQMNHEIDKVESLKKQLNEKTQELEQTKKALHELEEKFNVSKTTLEAKILDLEKEKQKLIERMQNERTVTTDSVWEQKCSYLEKQIKLQEKQIETLQNEVTHYKKRSFEAMESVSKLEKLKQQQQQSQALINELQATLNKYKDYETILPKLKSEALQNAENEKKIRILQKENESLKERIQNVEVLKEEILSLKQQLDNKDKLLSQYTKMKVEYDTLLKYKSEWESLLNNLSPFPSAESVRNTISELKKENLVLTENKGKLETELKVLQNTLIQKDQKIAHLKQKVKHFQKCAREAQETQEQQEKYLQLVIKERDSLKELLQSYDLEEKKYSTNQKRKKRIEELEKLMAEKNALIEQNHAELKKLQEMKFQLEKQIEKDNKEIEQLAERVRVLEQRLGKGDYDPLTTRVLHFKDNPAALVKKEKRDQEIQKLKDEIKELQTQNELLKAASKNETVNVALNELEKVKEELKKTKELLTELHQKLTEAEIKIKEGEIRMQRLQEVCTKKIQEFKEACHFLFGYQIDFDDNLGRRYRLLSKYAEKETDFLLFHWSSKTKTMSLLESDFSKTLLPQITQFLKEGNSIPAFLSDLTLRLFNKRRQQ